MDVAEGFCFFEVYRWLDGRVERNRLWEVAWSIVMKHCFYVSRVRPCAFL